MKSFNILIYYSSKFIYTVAHGKKLEVLIKLLLKVDESWVVIKYKEVVKTAWL